jgi:hypothetical protein
MSISTSLRVIATDFGNRVICGEENNSILIAKKAKPQPWFFDVICHGNASGIPIPLINGRYVEITVEQLATFIKAQPGYHKQPVRLLMCWVGKDPNGFAQRLANSLHVPVLASPCEVRADLLECLESTERFRAFLPEEADS